MQLNLKSKRRHQVGKKLHKNTLEEQDDWLFPNKVVIYMHVFCYKGRRAKEGKKMLMLYSDVILLHR